MAFSEQTSPQQLPFTNPTLGPTLNSKRPSLGRRKVSRLARRLNDALAALPTSHTPAVHGPLFTTSCRNTGSHPASSSS